VAWRDGGQLERLEDEHLAAVADAALHAVSELAVWQRREPLLRERRMCAVAAAMSEAARSMVDGVAVH